MTIHTGSRLTSLTDGDRIRRSVLCCLTLAHLHCHLICCRQYLSTACAVAQHCVTGTSTHTHTSHAAADHTTTCGMAAQPTVTMSSHSPWPGRVALAILTCAVSQCHRLLGSDRTWPITHCYRHASLLSPDPASLAGITTNLKPAGLNSCTTVSILNWVEICYSQYDWTGTIAAPREGLSP